MASISATRRVSSPAPESPEPPERPKGKLAIQLPAIIPPELGYRELRFAQPSVKLRLEPPVFAAVFARVRQRAHELGRVGVGIGVDFNEAEGTIAVHLDPIHAKREVCALHVPDVIGAEWKTGIDADIESTYQDHLIYLADLWRDTAGHLVDESFVEPFESSVSPSRDTYVEVMRSVAQGSFAVGEFHLDNSSLCDFLASNANHLRRAGIDTVYTEYFTSEMHEACKRPDGSLDVDRALNFEPFVQALHSWPYGSLAVEAMRSLDAAGIRVVGIDSGLCYPIDMDSEDFEEEDEDYQRASMNILAATAVEEDRRGRDGNFILWTGASHVNSVGSSDPAPPARGINMAFNMPSVMFTTQDSNEWGVFARADADAFPQKTPDLVAAHEQTCGDWSKPNWNVWVASPRGAPMSIDA